MGPLLKKHKNALDIRATFFIYFFSEVVLGEYNVGEDPDCVNTNCNPPVIRRGVRKIIVHEDYDQKSLFANDIALIRLDKAVPLHFEDQGVSGAQPICLPWNENDVGRNTKDGDRYVN